MMRGPSWDVGPRVLWVLVLFGLAAVGFEGSSPRARSNEALAAAARTPGGRDVKSPEPHATVARALSARPGPETAVTRVIDGGAWIGANDLARLLDATKYWRPDVRKLELRSGGHRILLTVDNPFVLVDDATIRLDEAVRPLKGEIQVPVALLDSLPHDSTLARLVFDPARRVVLRVPASGLVGAPRLSVEGGTTRLTFPVDRPEEVSVTSRSRAHFRVHFRGFFMGSLPDTLRGAGMILGLRPIPSAMGIAFELALASHATGFQVIRDAEGGRLALVFAATAREGFETFAPEGPPGPRPLRVVAIDPGHGGADGGVRVQGAVEKDLTLALARLVKAELGRRLPARVVLTREDDSDVSAEQRAERANRAGADLVLSLHFDGFSGSKARGATAFCSPAIYGSSAFSQSEARGAFTVLPWRDVATRHAVESRELAEDLLSSLELRGHGPTRLRELLPYALLGVNAPGLMLECATLTSDADRGRVTGAQGLNELAVSIAAGVEAYARGK